MKQELFDELVASVREGGQILKGKVKPSRAFVVTPTSIKKLRKAYGLSQGDFAAVFGIKPATLKNWEQGRRKPEGAAKVLLQIAAQHPEAVWDTVRPLEAAASKPRAGMRDIEVAA